MSERWGAAAFFVPLLATAQVDSTALLPAGPTHRITVEATGGYDSNVLRNDLVMALYRGGAIDRDLRQRTLDQLGATNRAGYQLGGSFTYTWGDRLAGMAGWGPRLGVSTESMLGMQFSKDAFALSFFGNAAYEGSTAALGPSRFEQVSFQSLRLGAEHRKSGSFFELALVNGRSLHTGNIRRADLYTAPDGRYLELDLDGEYHLADTAGTSASRGLGAALNALWKHELRLFGAPAFLTVSVSDLGFIAWNANALSVNKDSTIHYEGLEVTGILDLDDLVLNTHSLQDSLGLGYAHGGFTRMLPARAGIALGLGKSYATRSGDRLNAYTIAVDQRMIPGYVPRASVQRNVEISQAFSTSLAAVYGGLGGLRADLGIGLYPSAHVAIGIHTPNAIGLFANGAQGKSAALRVDVAW